LEDRIKKEIESRLKRGRVTCVINLSGGQAPGVFVNKQLLHNYIGIIKNIKEECAVKDDVRLDTLIHLPGILTLAESRVPKERVWPRLKILIDRALDELARARQKEGQALLRYLQNRSRDIEAGLENIKAKYSKTIQLKLKSLVTNEERTAFLKETDIAEEVQRLEFHIKHFRGKLGSKGPVGKELDFIAQEMQREANTIGAKSCSAQISSRVVQIKSQIEKIREQVQNIE
jgi:uncharacterized protein (TIGR00255 family)